MGSVLPCPSSWPTPRLASAGLLKTGGYVVLAFAAVGVYVFYGAASLATGGKGVNLGPPLQH